MTLDLAAFEKGITDYWTEVAARGAEIEARERAFPLLADRFVRRQPPCFSRSDLEEIITWKHNDRRRRNAALRGLKAVSDARIEELTGVLERVVDPCCAASVLRDQIKGVGPATVSAVLAAAKPMLFPVIDLFALIAVGRHYDPCWLKVIPRNKKGEFDATFETYGPFTDFCRDRANELTVAAGTEWTPRRVDMALWAIGKQP